MPMLALALLQASPAAALNCTVASSERRVPLLELYTSEGCDSCPPTDRWLSALPGRGFGSEHVVALAFHVDYWDYIGWRDHFAQKRFTERQRQIAARSGSRVVYTPQLVLNGRDYRRGSFRDDFAQRIADIHVQKPRAALKLAVQPAGDTLVVSGHAVLTDAAGQPLAQTWLALYENRLATEVKAGENRGKRLEHDFVVRDIVGPLAVDARGASIEHRFRLGSQWKPRDLGVAAFVQDIRNGDVLQALDCAAGQNELGAGSKPR
ncbi:MAG: DUF1223 domain-containing protein [Betaproteobacteria bacterium]